jgi:LysR family transcriptional activator of glutamate synthase operon
MIGAMLIRDLGWLVALAEREHVTEAAAALGTSQPTLSRALARVETELGARLFERSPDGVHVTPAGALAVEAAREITARLVKLRSDVESELDADSGVVRLAFLYSLASSVVPQVLGAFHQHAPRVRVLLSQEPAHEISRDLATGAVDLAITSVLPGAGYGWFPLHVERLVLVVPPHHRLRARKRVALAEVADDQLVTTPVGFGHRALVDDLLREAGVTPEVSFESQDLATIEGLVAAGLGVAILPEALAGHSGTIGIPLSTRAARRAIGLTWRADRDLAAPAARFRDHVMGSQGTTRPSR